jgi:type II secretion system protein H
MARRARIRRTRGTGRARGFSILELLVALALLTVVATLSIWAFFSRGEVTLENAAKLLADDLQIAQSRAVYMKTAVEVRFDDDGLGYRLSDASGRKSGIPALDLEGRRYDADAVFEGVRVQEIHGARISMPERSVVFDARGSIDHTMWITLAYRGETRTIELDARTGACVVADAARR